MQSEIINYNYYSSEKIGTNFKWPKIFCDFVKDAAEIDAWWFIGFRGEYADLCFEVINDKVDEGVVLVPFAKCGNTDSIACFDGMDVSGDPKIFFYDNEETLSNVDWNARYKLSGFEEWLSSVNSKEI